MRIAHASGKASIARTNTNNIIRKATHQHDRVLFFIAHGPCGFDHNTMQQKWNNFLLRLTFSGLLGPTITEMGIYFALKMLFRFSEPVFGLWLFE